MEQPHHTVISTDIQQFTSILTFSLSAAFCNDHESQKDVAARSPCRTPLGDDLQI